MTTLGGMMSWTGGGKHGRGNCTLLKRCLMPMRGIVRFGFLVIIPYFGRRADEDLGCT